MTKDAETFDPTDVQLRSLQGQEDYTFNADDLANTTGVSLLLQLRYVDLTELKLSKRELERLRAEDHELRIDRERLNIEIAKLQERERISLAEIIVGGLFGYALSLVGSDFRSGLVLLVVSVFLLIIMKNAQLLATIRGKNRKDQRDATYQK